MTTVVFTGDIAFSEYFKDAWREPVTDSGIDAFLASADHVAANVEGPVTARVFDSGRTPNHASAPEAAAALRAMHMDVWCLSNNHILDRGEGGAEDVLAAARAHGALPLGLSDTQNAPPRAVILGRECKVGLLAATDSRPYLKDGRLLLLEDEEPLRTQLRALRQQADYVVAVVHAGREYASMPLPPERREYKKLLRWGADVVVAHHPHVVQNYERVGDKLIFYSLGNFIFDTPTQRQFRYTDRGVLLKLHFSNSGIDWSCLPYRIDRQRQRVCVEETLPAIFQAVSRSDYALLWPLAAAVYRQNCLKKSRYFGGPAPQPLSRRLLRKMKRLNSPEAWTILAGRALARLGVWRLCRRKDLAAYLREGAPGAGPHGQKG